MICVDDNFITRTEQIRKAVILNHVRWITFEWFLGEFLLFVKKMWNRSFRSYNPGCLRDFYFVVVITRLLA